MGKRRFKKILQIAEDLWVFEVDLMLDDFKLLKQRVDELETRIEHHADMIYNKLKKKDE